MGLSARGRAMSCRASRYQGMRRVRRRTAGPAHDAEGGGGHEQARLRHQGRHEDAAGLRQSETAALQISARDQLHHGTAENGNGKDRPASVDEDVAAPVIASVAKQSIPPLVAIWIASLRSQ